MSKGDTSPRGRVVGEPSSGASLRWKASSSGTSPHGMGSSGDASTGTSAEWTSPKDESSEGASSEAGRVGPWYTSVLCQSGALTGATPGPGTAEAATAVPATAAPAAADPATPDPATAEPGGAAATAVSDWRCAAAATAGSP